MNKNLGYILGIAGLVIAVFSLNISRLKIGLPSFIKTSYILIIGVALIGAGVILLMNKGSGKAKQIAEEVPIYHKNKIVGYRKEHK